MPAKDAADRKTIAQIAVDSRWAFEPDRIAATQPMRDARRAKYLERVDPDGLLPEPERQRRADSLLRADMRRLALKSAQSRRAKTKNPPNVTALRPAAQKLVESDSGDAA
jgi:hypothetical protein